MRQERPAPEALLVLNPLEERCERREPRSIVGQKEQLSVELLRNVAHFVVIIEPKFTTDAAAAVIGREELVLPRPCEQGEVPPRNRLHALLLHLLHEPVPQHPPPLLEPEP